MTEGPGPILALYPPRARPTSTPLALGNAGGVSGASLWRFDSGLGPLLARAWPVEGPGPAALDRIHAWLGRLAGLDFIPVPVATLAGRTWTNQGGRTWEVAPWLPGLADESRPPASARLVAAAAGLAAVHRRLGSPSRTAPGPGLSARLEEMEGWLGSGLDRLDAALKAVPTDPASDLARRWSRLARDGLRPVAARLRREASRPTPIQPVLRDARADHFLFDGDRLTGLVDFGAMGIDSPAADLARLLGDWTVPGSTAWTTFLDAYSAARPLTAGEVRLIDTFAESAAWLGPARWARWRFLDGRRFDDPDAVRRGLERTLERLSDRLRSSGLGHPPH